MNEKQEKLFRQWLIGYFATECGTKEITDITERGAVSATKKADEVMKLYNDLKLIK